MDYIFFQHYWWAIVSLLGGILVFLLFVQGGQAMLYIIGRTDAERNTIAYSLGLKWALTFTTLVTFGGAFFASFPLFYSTSFGGAFYVWMLILFVFVIQAAGYEFRNKPSNFLGKKTYNIFLCINGLLGPLLLGTAVATLFTGAQFTVNKLNLTTIGGFNTISVWDTPWRGLDALADYRNISLGLAVCFLAQILGLQYFMNDINDKAIVERSRKFLIKITIPFLVFFLTFAVSLLLSKGHAVDRATGIISLEPYKYLHNLLQMPVVAVIFLAGVVSVLWGILIGILKASRSAIWFSGAGTVFTVFALLLLAGWNNTAYYPSLTNMQSSLTIFNSSSSEFTLKTMSVVSLLVPFVLAYIWYVWKSMNSKQVTKKEAAEDNY
jgi:cytochrome d ubiquinol oxidase subunit II